MKPSPVAESLRVHPLKAALVIELTAGEPEVATVNEPAVPWVNVVLAALVKVGAEPTVTIGLPE